MRFLSFVQDEFTPCMCDNLQRARTVLESYRGSWEVWAQVQVALRVAARPGYAQCRFEREINFPNSPLVCDFRINPDSAAGNYIWVELKVLLSSGPGALVRRFLGDVDKLSGIGGLGNNTGGAICFAPNDADEVIRELRAQVNEGQRHRYSFYLLRPDEIERVRKLSEPGSIPRDRGAVVYRAILGEP